MGVDATVSMAIAMQQQSLREQVSFGVTKMAIDRMEQFGQDITQMMDESAIAVDPNLGNLVDIIA